MFWADREKKMETRSVCRLLFWAASEKKMETRSGMQTDVLSSPRKKDRNTLRHTDPYFEQLAKKRWKRAQTYRLMFWGAHEKKMGTRLDMETAVLGGPRKKDGNTLKHVD